MRPLSLVTQQANLAGVGYKDDNIIIMRHIIAMVDQRHGGGVCRPTYRSEERRGRVRQDHVPTWQFIRDTHGCGDEGASTIRG